jgi:hypothetical protein
MLQRGSVIPTQLSGTTWVAVKHGYDRQACFRCKQAHPAHFMIGDSKATNRIDGVQRAHHSLHNQMCAVAAAEQDSAALARVSGFAGISQLNAMLRGDFHLSQCRLPFTLETFANPQLVVWAFMLLGKLLPLFFYVYRSLG